MGPVRSPKSTRAQRGHSVNSSPKPRRKPTAPKPSKLRTAAEALRDFARALAPRAADPPHISPTQAVREMRDGVPTTTLQGVQAGLETVSALITVCADVLDARMVDAERDVAIVLQRCALDTLARQKERIESLLNEGTSSCAFARNPGAHAEANPLRSLLEPKRRSSSPSVRRFCVKCVTARPALSFPGFAANSSSSSHPPECWGPLSEIRTASLIVRLRTSGYSRH